MFFVARGSDRLSIRTFCTEVLRVFRGSTLYFAVLCLCDSKIRYQEPSAGYIAGTRLLHSSSNYRAALKFRWRYNRKKDLVETLKTVSIVTTKRTTKIWVSENRSMGEAPLYIHSIAALVCFSSALLPIGACMFVLTKKQGESYPHQRWHGPHGGGGHGRVASCFCARGECVGVLLLSGVLYGCMLS